jgi:hypothetical protein
LQDAIKFSQERPGTFEIPNWDEAGRVEGFRSAFEDFDPNSREDVLPFMTDWR